MAKPLMAKATAVWLIDNTGLTFKQIGDFVNLHELEIQGIADEDVAIGVRGFDPIANNQLDMEEIKKAEADPSYKLKLKFYAATVGEKTRTGPRYTPLSKRQDRPAAIYWLVKFHPEMSDGQISKLVGTTKPTIKSIRERTHWNISNIQPVDPVALGFCRQSELDSAVEKAAKRVKHVTPSEGEGAHYQLLSTEESLGMSTEPRLPTSMSGLESFSLSEKPEGGTDATDDPLLDPERLFNQPDVKRVEDK